MGCLDNYPKHVLLVLVNEFCERFSYYGMKVILVLYLTRALKYSDSAAVSIYHAFSAVCYFTPVLGAMVADGWLGKFKTILYVSMIYALGNISMSVTAIPFGGEYLSWGVFIGLVLIGIGSGGIKPCVSAFGGDQFKPDQVKQKDSFFSLFYMFINIGSLLTTIITPYVRSNVFCFDDNCYCLAFGIPAILMVISIVVFAIGSPWYTKYPAGESILSRIFGCVWTALKCKLKCGKTQEEKADHWLDYAEPKYGSEFVSDVKDVFAVLWLFLPLPFFWAVYDQQGSRWTLQATQMDGDFGSFVMQPDMMGIMNSIMVVTLAPLLSSVIYPILDKLHIPNTPLQRMTFGMLFAATAFLLSGFIQVVIEDSFPAVPGEGQSKVIFINSGPCNATVEQLWTTDIEAFDINQYTSTEYMTIDSGPKSFNLTWNCTEPNHDFNYMLVSEKGYQIVLLGQYLNDGTLNQTQMAEQMQLTPTPDSSSAFSFYNDLNYAIDLKLHATKSQEKDQTIYDIQPQSFSEKVKLVFAEFDVYMTNTVTNKTITLPKRLQSKNGAIYTVLLANDTGKFVMEQLTDMEPRTVNIFLQVPQYLLLTIGECLFSITGLAFAYSQAPASMKSLLTAAWLLTVAVGNLIIIIIAETTSDTGNEVMIFFLFAGLLYVVTVLFAIMSYFYKYVEVKVVDDNKSITSSSSSSSSSSGSSHSEKGKKPVEMAVVEEKAPLPSNDALDADSVKVTELNEKPSPPHSDSGFLAASASDVNNDSVSVASNDSDEATHKF